MAASDIAFLVKRFIRFGHQGYPRTIEKTKNMRLPCRPSVHQRKRYLVEILEVVETKFLGPGKRAL